MALAEETGDGFARLDVDDAVATLTIERPDRLNALGRPVTAAVLACLDEAEGDRAVRALVLVGAGRAFSAGGDMADVATDVLEGDEWTRLSLLRELQMLTVRVRDSRLPVVAAVSGPAYGAGWSVALACDMIVAARDARFQQAFVHRNLVPDLGSAWLLPRVVGSLRAKELILLGEELDAATAHELGLVTRLADDRDQALALATELAARIAAAAPATVAMAKRLVNRSEALGFEDSLRLEEHAQALALGAADTQAAVRAFVERRKSA